MQCDGESNRQGGRLRLLEGDETRGRKNQQLSLMGKGRSQRIAVTV